MADKVAVTTKQKVIGVLTVVILAFIIYEVIGLFSTEKAAEPVIVPAKPAAGEKTPKPAATAQTNRGTEQPQLTTVNALTAPGSNIDFQKQREQQEAYLDSVNQLQLLRVKREIAETNQAIAAARLATETANKNMSDLLTQPAVMPEAPAGNNVGTYGEKTGTAQPANQNAQPVKQPLLDVPFTVVSVSMQLNRWSAVLGYEDKLYSVSLGDSLFDGSKVVSINKSGVTLMKDGKRRRISIQTTI